MASAGGAVVIDDDKLDRHPSGEELDGLLEDPDRLGRMGEAARQLARPDAAQDVACLAEEHARRKPSRA